MIIEDRIKTIVSEKLNIDLAEIKGNSHFVEDLGADSLDIVELIMALEDEFKIEVEDEEVENIKTLNDFINYLNSKGV